MARTVFCEYEQRETEGLDFAPWPGEPGQRVLARIGKGAWSKWLAHQTMLINENRLSPMNPEHRTFLLAEMEKFLFAGGAEKPAGYSPEVPPGADADAASGDDGGAAST
jgi:Fe-S cluster biosynthesis and repair protein YggX